MAELNNQTNPQGQENSGTENETPRTYTQEEVDELLQRETDRRVSSALAKAEKKHQSALRESERLASMSAEEKFRYELEQKEQLLNEREHALLLMENRAEASKVLAERGLSQAFLDFVVDETADLMNEKIQKIDKAFKASVKAEVEKRLGTNTPKTSITDSKPLTKEEFRNLTPTEKQHIFDTDKDLWNQMTK